MAASIIQHKALIIFETHYGEYPIDITWKTQLWSLEINAAQIVLISIQV